LGFDQVEVVVNDLGGEADGTGKSASPANEVVKVIKDAGVDPQDIPAAWLGNWQGEAYLLDYSYVIPWPLALLRSLGML
jgi:hypothetical protein